MADMEHSQDSDKNPKSTLNENKKTEQLQQYLMPTHEEATSAKSKCPFRFLQNQTGVNISQRSNDNTLKVGPRGPTLIANDFFFREKIQHFDHERIPERVVHARGSGAHGYFQVYKDMSHLTKAKFLSDPSIKTPVFVRFSTVIGERGSSDTVRDVRGFATKFYTEEGNFDIVGNNIPVFFIQDAIKFPDLVHAAKPEPHNSVPQAQTAHDNFWDFMSLMPESKHMSMWILSDRAIPRSYRMMEGFGVNTFVLVNSKGERRFIKWHWKPVLGVHSLAWDEAHKLAGIDPDFHRKDLYEAIETGNYPEYELGVQIIEEKDEHSFDFDILDATKIIPEELVPVTKIGKMTLNRNPNEFFPETEQIAFCTQNIVPGIDFSNDPLLLGRNFSYLDTQLSRLGGPNFNEIAINRPICPVFNNQQEGFHRESIRKGKLNYWPNRYTKADDYSNYEEGDYNKEEIKSQAFHHYQERIEGIASRIRAPKFKEHVNQAKLFYNSLTEVEKLHIIQAAQFEFGHVADIKVRERMIDYLNSINNHLAASVAPAIGINAPKPLDDEVKGTLKSSPSVSQAVQQPKVPSVATRKVAFLLSDGYSGTQWLEISTIIRSAGAIPVVISNRKGPIPADDGKTQAECGFTFWTAKSVLFDSVVIIGGPKHIEGLKSVGDCIAFVNEAAKHCKAIMAVSDGVSFINDDDGCHLGKSMKGGVQIANNDKPFCNDQGIVTAIVGGEHKTDDSNKNILAEAKDTIKEGVKSAVHAVIGGAGEWAFATQQFLMGMSLHRAWTRHVKTIPA